MNGHDDNDIELISAPEGAAPPPAVAAPQDSLEIQLQRMEAQVAQFRAALRASGIPADRPLVHPAAPATTDSPPAGAAVALEQPLQQQQQQQQQGEPRASPRGPPSASLPDSPRSARSAMAPASGSRAAAVAQARQTDDESLVVLLQRVCDTQDLVDAARAFNVALPSWDPEDIARSLVSAGVGWQVLEQAATASPRGGRDGPAVPGPVLPPPSRSGAVGGRTDGATVSTVDPTSLSLHDQLAGIRQALAASQHRSALSEALEGQLSGPLRGRFLNDQVQKPSDRAMAALTKLARDTTGAALDLNLECPHLGAEMEQIVSSSNANHYCMLELKWSIIQLKDELSLLYRALVTLSVTPMGDAATQALSPFVDRLQDMWSLIHGHMLTQEQRLRALAQGIVQRHFVPRPPVPASSAIYPIPLVTSEEIAKWRKSAPAPHAAPTEATKRALSARDDGPRKFGKFASDVTPASPFRGRGRGRPAF